MRGRGGSTRLRTTSRGQTETIGVVLILAITLIGATVALAFGASGLDAARLDAQEGGVEHAMTQLDSRSAMVALGDSASQRVSLSASGQGGYRVDPEAGWINVTHSNYGGNDEVETIYNESLGVLLYERDDTQVAYQGGGVWRRQGTSTIMVSPPEFHYQSATLTLPVIRVRGDSNVGGASATAQISRETSSSRIYPNRSEWYPATGGNFTNPVREGNVTVTVKSEYYQGWAHYFETRTTGDLTVDHENQTASVKLISFGTNGPFQVPADGNSMDLRGIGAGHPISNFNLTLQPDDTDAADFDNLEWSMYAKQGSEEFEINLLKGKLDNDPTTSCKERHVEMTVYYSESGGEPYHAWHNETALRTKCDDIDGDGNDEIFLEVDLLSDTELELKERKNSDLIQFSPGNTLEDPVVFDEHGDEGVEWEKPKAEFEPGDETTIGNLTNHYLSVMGPNVELIVADSNQDSVSEDASTGEFEQSGSSGQFITFLHITENRVVLELE